MRKTIHGLLIADGPLTALIPTERWFQLGAVIDVPKRPFAILQWLSPVTGNGKGSFAHQLQVHIHTDRGSYTDIDKILGGPHRSGGVYPILAAVAGVTGPDGYVTQCDYLGTGGDDVDPDRRTNTKYSSWQIIGRTTG